MWGFDPMLSFHVDLEDYVVPGPFFPYFQQHFPFITWDLHLTHIRSVWFSITQLVPILSLCPRSGVLGVFICPVWFCKCFSTSSILYVAFFYVFWVVIPLSHVRHWCFFGKGGIILRHICAMFSPIYLVFETRRLLIIPLNGLKEANLGFILNRGYHGWHCQGNCHDSINALVVRNSKGLSNSLGGAHGNQLAFHLEQRLPLLA